MKLRASEIDELMRMIAEMDRDELIDQFRSYPAPFKVDFTDEFLASQSLDKLRHVFAGLCMHCGRMPAIAA
ncbi:MAG: hypothetical protein QM770_11820 [Tepidisphaeraceae bacterium]